MPKLIGDDAVKDGSTLVLLTLLGDSAFIN